MTTGSETIKNHAAFIWSVADLLRGDYKQSEYGKVVLPLTVLRRFDCVLAPVKADILAQYERLQGKVENFAPTLRSARGVARSSTCRAGEAWRSYGRSSSGASRVDSRCEFSHARTAHSAASRRPT